MAIPDVKTLPLDPGAVAAASAQGLEYRLIDTDDAAAFGAYLRSVDRGFLEAEPTDERLQGTRDALAYRRPIGLFDASSADTAMPVATVDSWIVDQTVPGGRSIPMWAISDVSVAPTHRRRGIARTMLEAELRTAAAAGVALAGLTVSEATIYHRFGFAPATFVSEWTLDTARTHWVGPRPEGRIDFISREEARELLPIVHERVRLTRPGEIRVWPGRWSDIAGMKPGQEDVRAIRALRYLDADGQPRGLAVYRLREDPADFTKHTLQVNHLLAETDDAYAALWRMLLEYDLVSTVKASLLSVDEPLRWMIADQRGATVKTSDHGWLRILDVATVLEARSYAAPGAFALRITDAHGFADGTWQLEIASDGSANVHPTDAAPDVTMSVNELSSLLLGGVRVTTLRAAGRLSAAPDTTAALDACVAAPRTPYLSVWY